MGDPGKERRRRQLLGKEDFLFSLSFSHGLWLVSCLELLCRLTEKARRDMLPSASLETQKLTKK